MNRKVLVVLAVVAVVVLSGCFEEPLYESKSVISFGDNKLIKSVRITQTSHVETISLPLEYGKPEDFVVFSAVPKDLAANASEVQFETQNHVTILKSDPVFEFTSEKGEALEVQMTFAKGGKEICTINSLLPKAFVEALTNEQKEELIGRQLDLLALGLDCERASELERELAEDLAVLFTGVELKKKINRSAAVIEFQDGPVPLGPDWEEVSDVFEEAAKRKEKPEEKPAEVEKEPAEEPGFFQELFDKVRDVYKRAFEKYERPAPPPVELVSPYENIDNVAIQLKPRPNLRKALREKYPYPEKVYLYVSEANPKAQASFEFVNQKEFPEYGTQWQSPKPRTTLRGELRSCCIRYSISPEEDDPVKGTPFTMTINIDLDKMKESERLVTGEFREIGTARLPSGFNDVAVDDGGLYINAHATLDATGRATSIRISKIEVLKAKVPELAESLTLRPESHQTFLDVTDYFDGFEDKGDYWVWEEKSWDDMIVLNEFGPSAHEYRKNAVKELWLWKGRQPLYKITPVTARKINFLELHFFKRFTEVKIGEEEGGFSFENFGQEIKHTLQFDFRMEGGKQPATPIEVIVVNQDVCQNMPGDCLLKEAEKSFQKYEIRLAESKKAFDEFKKEYRAGYGEEPPWRLVSKFKLLNSANCKSIKGDPIFYEEVEQGKKLPGPYREQLGTQTFDYVKGHEILEKYYTNACEAGKLLELTKNQYLVAARVFREELPYSRNVVDMVYQLDEVYEKLLETYHAERNTLGFFATLTTMQLIDAQEKFEKKEPTFSTEMVVFLKERVAEAKQNLEAAATEDEKVFSSMDESMDAAIFLFGNVLAELEPVGKETRYLEEVWIARQKMEELNHELEGNPFDWELQEKFVEQEYQLNKFSAEQDPRSTKEKKEKDLAFVVGQRKAQLEKFFLKNAVQEITEDIRDLEDLYLITEGKTDKLHEMWRMIYQPGHAGYWLTSSTLTEKLAEKLGLTPAAAERVEQQNAIRLSISTQLLWLNRLQLDLKKEYNEKDILVNVMHELVKDEKRYPEKMKNRFPKLQALIAIEDIIVQKDRFPNKEELAAIKLNEATGYGLGLGRLLPTGDREADLPHIAEAKYGNIIVEFEGTRAAEDAKELKKWTGELTKETTEEWVIDLLNEFTDLRVWLLFEFGLVFIGPWAKATAHQGFKLFMVSWVGRAAKAAFIRVGPKLVSLVKWFWKVTPYWLKDAAGYVAGDFVLAGQSIKMPFQLIRVAEFKVLDKLITRIPRLGGLFKADYRFLIRYSTIFEVSKYQALNAWARYRPDMVYRLTKPYTAIRVSPSIEGRVIETTIAGRPARVVVHETADGLAFSLFDAAGKPLVTQRVVNAATGEFVEEGRALLLALDVSPRVLETNNQALAKMINLLEYLKASESEISQLKLLQGLNDVAYREVRGVGLPKVTVRAPASEEKALEELIHLMHENKLYPLPQGAREGLMIAQEEFGGNTLWNLMGRNEAYFPSTFGLTSKYCSRNATLCLEAIPKPRVKPPAPPKVPAVAPAEARPVTVAVGESIPARAFDEGALVSSVGKLNAEEFVLATGAPRITRVGKKAAVAVEDMGSVARMEVNSLPSIQERTIGVNLGTAQEATVTAERLAGRNSVTLGETNFSSIDKVWVRRAAKGELEPGQVLKASVDREGVMHVIVSEEHKGLRLVLVEEKLPPNFESLRFWQTAKSFETGLVERPVSYRAAESLFISTERRMSEIGWGLQKAFFDDAVEGTLTRGGFKTVLGESLQTGVNSQVVNLTIVDLKGINTVYGHATVDGKILPQLTKEIKRAFRERGLTILRRYERDAIAHPYGGDFWVMVRSKPGFQEEMKVAVEQALNDLEKPMADLLGSLPPLPGQQPMTAFSARAGVSSPSATIRLPVDDAVNELINQSSEALAIVRAETGDWPRVILENHALRAEVSQITGKGTQKSKFYRDAAHRWGELPADAREAFVPGPQESAFVRFGRDFELKLSNAEVELSNIRSASRMQGEFTSQHYSGVMGTLAEYNGVLTNALHEVGVDNFGNLRGIDVIKFYVNSLKAQGKRVRVIKTDFDNFSKFNELRNIFFPSQNKALFGREVGDEVLKVSSRIMREEAVASRGQCFRLHGDEFIFVGEWSEQEASALVARVNQRINSEVGFVKVVEGQGALEGQLVPPKISGGSASEGNVLELLEKSTRAGEEGRLRYGVAFYDETRMGGVEIPYRTETDWMSNINHLGTPEHPEKGLIDLLIEESVAGRFVGAPKTFAEHITRNQARIDGIMGSLHGEAREAMLKAGLSEGESAPVLNYLSGSINKFQEDPSVANLFSIRMPTQDVVSTITKVRGAPLRPDEPIYVLNQELSKLWREVPGIREALQRNELVNWERVVIDRETAEVLASLAERGTGLGNQELCGNLVVVTEGGVQKLKALSVQTDVQFCQSVHYLPDFVKSEADVMFHTHPFSADVPDTIISGAYFSQSDYVYVTASQIPEVITMRTPYGQTSIKLFYKGKEIVFPVERRILSFEEAMSIATKYPEKLAPEAFLGDDLYLALKAANKGQDLKTIELVSMVVEGEELSLEAQVRQAMAKVITLENPNPKILIKRMDRFPVGPVTRMEVIAGDYAEIVSGGQLDFHFLGRLYPSEINQEILKFGPGFKHLRSNVENLYLPKIYSKFRGGNDLYLDVDNISLARRFAFGEEAVEFTRRGNPADEKLLDSLRKVRALKSKQIPEWDDDMIEFLAENLREEGFSPESGTFRYYMEKLNSFAEEQALNDVARAHPGVDLARVKSENLYGYQGLFQKYLEENFVPVEIRTRIPAEEAVVAVK